jgi:hemerythrin-like metal-binding protein
MAVFEWKDDYSVNIAAMDEQHKKLVALLNGLDIAIVEGKDEETLSTTLDGLMDYVLTHFKSEEELMKKNDYPQIQEHRQAHFDLTIKVVELKKAHEAYHHQDSARQVIMFLTKWLMSHIMGVDKRYGVFLNKKSVF